MPIWKYRLFLIILGFLTVFDKNKILFINTSSSKQILCMILNANYPSWAFWFSILILLMIFFQKYYILESHEGMLRMWIEDKPYDAVKYIWLQFKCSISALKWGLNAPFLLGFCDFKAEEWSGWLRNSIIHILILLITFDKILQRCPFWQPFNIFRDFQNLLQFESCQMARVTRIFTIDIAFNVGFAS